MKDKVFCGGSRGGGDAVYGLGFLGSLVYFLQHSSSVQDGLMGIVKALLWPAFLLYRLPEMIKF